MILYSHNKVVFIDKILLVLYICHTRCQAFFQRATISTASSKLSKRNCNIIWLFHLKKSILNITKAFLCLLFTVYFVYRCSAPNVCVLHQFFLQVNRISARRCRLVSILDELHKFRKKQRGKIYEPSKNCIYHLL